LNLWGVVPEDWRRWSTQRDLARAAHRDRSTGPAPRLTPAKSVPCWEAPDRAIPGRPCPHGLKAPLARRRERQPTRGQADWREPQRRHPTDPADRRPPPPARARQAWSATQKPDRLLADRGYDHDKHRRLLRALGITPVIARRGTANGSGLGRQRWVVERDFAHLHNFRRLRIRYERDPDMHTAFLTLACSIPCWRRLNSL
jgi:transposase